jgi:hypothetical protein
VLRHPTKKLIMGKAVKARSFKKNKAKTSAKSGYVKPLYKPDQTVLVLGDGGTFYFHESISFLIRCVADFTFSKGLIAHRGSGVGVIATSYDSSCHVRKVYCRTPLRENRSLWHRNTRMLTPVYNSCNSPKPSFCMISTRPTCINFPMHVHNSLTLSFSISPIAASNACISTAFCSWISLKARVTNCPCAVRST